MNTQEIQDKLNSAGLETFATGSRKFGCAEERSDYDICIKTTDIKAIGDLLAPHFITTHQMNSRLNSYSGYYMTIEGKVFNLITLDDQFFTAWKLATNTMCELINQSEHFARRISYKDERVSLFKLFIDKVMPINVASPRHVADIAAGYDDVPF